jgi:hypothetical protein
LLTIPVATMITGMTKHFMLLIIIIIIIPLLFIDFLVLRLFRWMTYCVMLFSLVLCFFKYLCCLFYIYSRAAL